MVSTDKVKYKERYSNLELYRIIVMLLIVAHHYVVNSGLGDVMIKESLSAHSIFFYLFGAWGKTGINCFLMITGYFMCKSQITWRKFLKLLFEVEFYKITIYAIFVLSGYETFSVLGCIKSIIPMLDIRGGIHQLFSDFLSVHTFPEHPYCQYGQETTWATNTVMSFYLYTAWNTSNDVGNHELCVMVLCLIFHCFLYKIIFFKTVKECKLGGVLFTVHNRLCY